MPLVLLGCGSDGRPEAETEKSSEERAEGTAMPTLESLGGTSRRSDPRPSVDPDDWELPDPRAPSLGGIRVVYSQDNRGELEACGCPGAPTGGMARRLSLVRMMRQLRPEILLLEGPSALSPHVLGFEAVDGRDRARADMVLRTLALAEPAAFFPGQADFRVMTPRNLASRGRELGLKLVATNLSERSGGERYERSLVRTVEQKTVVFLGLIGGAGSQEQSQLVQREDTIAAVQRTLDGLRVEGVKPDMVVALTDADERDLRAWESAGLQVDLLLTPPAREGQEPIRMRPGWLQVSSEPLGRAFQSIDLRFGTGGGDGSVQLSTFSERLADIESKYIHELFHLRELEAKEEAGVDPRESSVGLDGKTRVDPRTDPAMVRGGLAELKALRSQVIEQIEPSDVDRVAVRTWVLETEIPEAEEVVRKLDDFGERRLERIALQLGVLEQTPESERFGGRASCTECHAGMDAHWTQTGHARAWKSLIDRGESKNPDCLPCHTTGFGLPGGFVDPAADRSLLNVQCEACHGPMLDHSIEAKGSRTAPGRGLVVTEATCRRCHDAANSPRFDFETYSERVGHPGIR